MELKTERVPVMFEPSLLEKIDDLRFANRIGSRAAMIRKLVQAGLNATDITENEKASSRS